MIYITQLRAAYIALRDYLVDMKLYDDEPTPGFDRQKLARLFTEYYDAEAAVKAAVAAEKAEKAAQKVSDDFNYLRNAFAQNDNTTDIEGGVVLSNFIGIKNGGKVVAGLSTGRAGQAEIPLLFAGADSVQSALQTATYSLSLDGVHRTRNPESPVGEIISIGNGNIVFSTYSRHGPTANKEIEALSMSPTSYTPSSSNMAFANTGLITGTSGDFKVRVDSADAILNSEISIDVTGRTAGDHDNDAWDNTIRLSETFAAGENATVIIPALTFTIIGAVRYYEYTPAPGGSRQILKTIFANFHTVLQLYLKNAQTGTKHAIASVSGTNVVTTQFSTMTLLPKGNYYLEYHTGGSLSFDSLPPASSKCWYSAGWCEGVTENTVVEFSVKWNTVSTNSKLFGNGWLYSKMADQYCGVIGNTSNFVFEHRSGTKGFRCDKRGMSQLKSDGSGWDNSGLLIGCLVDVNGTLKKRFGIKDKPAVRCDHPSAGQYQFFHYLGHTNYIVQVTPAFWGRYIAVVYDDKADSVIVEIRNVNGGYDNVQFNITIIGTP